MSLRLDEHPIPTESERVEAWRLQEALRLSDAVGRELPVADAERFAKSDGDLHRLEDLLAAGCDPKLAVEILA